MLLVIARLPAMCQEIELRAGEVVVTAVSSLYAQPAASAAVVGTVAAGVHLRWVESQTKNGFLQVVGNRGAPGWIASANVNVINNAAGPTSFSVQPAAPPCVRTLAACPLNGCSAPGSPHALLNQTKRRKPARVTPRAITFPDLMNLQSQADKLVGEAVELTAADRAKLKKLSIAGGSVDEGTLVQLAGYIATGPLSPHPNTGESVNCNFPDPASNDFHISFVEQPQGVEFNGIVVEMIPQKRPAGWTLTKLAALQQQRAQVLVRGALFYDNVHVINPDPNNDVPGQPRRFALWEIHPITEFLVCKQTTTRCDPNKPGDWAPLRR